MRKLTIAALAILAGLALGNRAPAQESDTPGTQPKVSKVDCMAKALNLTDQQKQQVEDILAKAKADAANAPDREARHEIFKAAWKNIRTNVLTDQQRTQMAQMHHGRHMKRTLEQLNLTPEQKTQVKAIFQQARTEATNATDVQTKKQIHKQAWQKIRNEVLTDAQRQQLDQMKAQWKAKHAPATMPS